MTINTALVTTSLFHFELNSLHQTHVCVLGLFKDQCLVPTNMLITVPHTPRYHNRAEDSIVNTSIKLSFLFCLSKKYILYKILIN